MEKRFSPNNIDPDWAIDAISPIAPLRRDEALTTKMAEVIGRVLDAPELTPAMIRWIDRYTQLEIEGTPRNEAQRVAFEEMKT
jgi:hypothetical protein